MITSMREYFRSLKFVLLIVIAAFILTSVVYLGTGTRGDGSSPGNAVATVNGEEIPLERFRRVHASYLEFYRQVYKERFTPDLAERLGLTQQVVNDLVQEALIVQQAEREGVRVSDEELRLSIQSIQGFQENGRFSRDRYLQALRRARVDAGEFEAEQRREIQRRKMEGLVKDGLKVSEGELMQAYTMRRETVRAAWASVEAQAFLAQVSIGDADAEAYLKSHQPRFTRPERRRLQYVVISPRSFAAPVSDAEAEAYYKEHGAEFETPRRLRTAHVLVRVPPVGGSEAENKSKAKVEEVIKRAKAGEDFAKLAKEVSEDTASAAQGGDLGLVGPGEMLPQFEQAVFALKKGEVSTDPVRTPFGYHAIKVSEVQEGGRKPFKEAAPTIKGKLLNERSDRGARTKADEVKIPLQTAKDFAAAARQLGLEVREATIARGDSLDGIGRERDLDEAIFSLAATGVSSAVKTPGGYAIVKVVEQFPSGVPPLAEIKDRVVEALKHDRALALAMDRAKALAATLAQGGEFMATAKREGFSTGETPPFSRAEPPKGGAPLPGGVLMAALQTATGQVAEPVQTPTGVYLVKTLARQSPDPLGLEKEREELRRQVLEQKQAQAWESWARGLRASAKIEITGPAAGAGR